MIITILKVACVFLGVAVALCMFATMFGIDDDQVQELLEEPQQ